MGRTIREERIEKELQQAYKAYVFKKWDECIDKRIRSRIVINFDNGKVTGVQDQAAIVGASLLSIHSNSLDTQIH